MLLILAVRRLRLRAAISLCFGRMEIAHLSMADATTAVSGLLAHDLVHWAW